MIQSSKKQIAQLLLAQFQIDVSKFNELFLSKSIQKAITQNNCKSENELCALIETNQTAADAFIESLHINYSEFFRNPLTFAVLENIILPSLAFKMKSNKRKEVRIWSAATASGQETYSLAMLLEEFNARSIQKLNYRIFATDQCPKIIAEAQLGQFSYNSVSNLKIKRVDQWFTKEGSNYLVNDELKKHIEFSVFDLLNENEIAPPASVFGNFDILFCANLLFYYKTDYREIIVKKIGHSLSKNGFLITGEAERDIFFNNSYNEVYQHSAIFQK